MTNPTINCKEIAATYPTKMFNVKDEYQNLPVEQLKELSAPSHPVAVCALNLVGDLNVGTMIRSACLFGLEKFIVFGRRKYDGRSTVGADNYIDIELVDGLTEDRRDIDIDKFVNYMTENHYIPVFIEQGGLQLGNFQWTPNLTPLFVKSVMKKSELYKLCFVFGNESFGISKELMDRFSEKLIVEIPQKGVLRSFNVSAAMNIVIWDYILQHS